MTTLSTRKRTTDKYEIELVGFKRYSFYAAKVLTPSGESEPEPGELVYANIQVETVPQPSTFLGSEINEDLIRFIALYHKLDPIMKKKVLVITSTKNRTRIMDDFISIAEKVIPSTFYVKKHRGKPAVFVTKPETIREVINTLGDRSSKKYPEWIVGTPFEKEFIEERLKDVLTPRANSVEVTSSSINNEIFMKILLNQGYYINVRRIEHRVAKSRDLAVISIYPTNDEHTTFFKNETGKNFVKRTKNIIDGKQYYQIISVKKI